MSPTTADPTVDPTDARIVVGAVVGALVEAKQAEPCRNVQYQIETIGA